MGIEIERKFLVRNDAWKSEINTGTFRITQGYMVKTTGLTVRIRVAAGQKTGWVTFKGQKTDISVPEFEYEIPAADADELLKMCNKSLIQKTRHCVVDAHNQHWEIDVFEGINTGLVVAELELDTVDQAITVPSWIGKEVSDDHRYSNTHLVDHCVTQL